VYPLIEKGGVMPLFTREEALAYHKMGRPGKIELGLTKPCKTQKDLSLAYTPGVAEPCREIHKDKENCWVYTVRGNLVAVITDGTAVLGLGNIGPLAGKPVMEGKCVLFKRFADVDAFDLEVDEKDKEKFIEIVAALEPTFGGINLEDIKAPECFYIEEQLIERMDIPVFHDDQHGTAIIVAAGLLNALEITGKKIDNIKVVFNGAGAAGIACAKLLTKMGVSREGMVMCDRHGIITEETASNKYKMEFASKKGGTLEDAMRGADVFIGVSVGGVVSQAMVKSMGKSPIIFAMANPDPEILPEAAKEARKDAIVATGRSDYPNQVNNVLGFPFIFRGALDVRARKINNEMKIAAAHALARLAHEEVLEEVRDAYGGAELKFGPDYIIPKPLDPRVLYFEAPAVAEAAMKSGVARIEIDIEKYREELKARIESKKG
jgi:malate dehydrogenase (oxaloacetate-decarboxylating)(NADP+)